MATMNYYVDSNIASSGDGLAPATAWKLLSNIGWAAIRAYIAANATDDVFLNVACGSVFYGSLSIGAGGSADHYFKISTYIPASGLTDWPQIWGAQEVTAFTDQGSDVWKSDSVIAATAINCCLGGIWGELQISSAACTVPGYFYVDGSKYLYVYAPSAPGLGPVSYYGFVRPVVYSLSGGSLIDYSGYSYIKAYNLIFRYFDGNALLSNGTGKDFHQAICFIVDGEGTPIITSGNRGIAFYKSTVTDVRAINCMVFGAAMGYYVNGGVATITNSEGIFCSNTGLIGSTNGTYEYSHVYGCGLQTISITPNIASGIAGNGNLSSYSKPDFTDLKRYSPKLSFVVDDATNYIGFISLTIDLWKAAGIKPTLAIVASSLETPASTITDWVDQGSNIYRHSSTTISTSQLMINGVLGVRVASAEECTQSRYWYLDTATNYIYVYSPSGTDPVTYYGGAIQRPAVADQVKAWAPYVDVVSHGWSHQNWNNTNVMNIRYLGAGADCIVTIGSNILTSVTGVAGDNLSVDLTDASSNEFAKLKTVVEAWNGGGKYTLTLTPTPSVGADNPNGTNAHSITLADQVTADCKAGAQNLLIDKQRFVEDELATSKALIEATIQAVDPAYLCKGYVWPGNYADTDTITWLIAAGYTGARFGDASAHQAGQLGRLSNKGQDIRAIDGIDVASALTGKTQAQVIGLVGTMLEQQQYWGNLFVLYHHGYSLALEQQEYLINALATYQDFDTFTNLLDWLSSNADFVKNTYYYLKKPATITYPLETPLLMINAGTDVGLPYNGPYPDIGAYEHSSQAHADLKKMFGKLIG